MLRRSLRSRGTRYLLVLALKEPLELDFAAKLFPVLPQKTLWRFDEICLDLSPALLVVVFPIAHATGPQSGALRAAVGVAVPGEVGRMQTHSPGWCDAFRERRNLTLGAGDYWDVE